MTQQLGRYRRDARLRIAEALAALPADATRKEAEAAITAANPYKGESGWLPQCWSRERKAALRRRFPDPPGNVTPETVAYELTTALPSGLPWLRVNCSWCGGKGPGYARDGVTNLGGCLACLAHCERVKQVVSSPDFKALRAEAARDAAAVVVLKDFLEEQGIEVAGA